MLLPLCVVLSVFDQDEALWIRHYKYSNMDDKRKMNCKIFGYQSYKAEQKCIVKKLPCLPSVHRKIFRAGIFCSGMMSIYGEVTNQLNVCAFYPYKTLMQCL